MTLRPRLGLALAAAAASMLASQRLSRGAEFDVTLKSPRWPSEAKNPKRHAQKAVKRARKASRKGSR